MRRVFFCFTVLLLFSCDNSEENVNLEELAKEAIINRAELAVEEAELAVEEAELATAIVAKIVKGEEVTKAAEEAAEKASKATKAVKNAKIAIAEAKAVKAETKDDIEFRDNVRETTVEIGFEIISKILESYFDR